MVIVAVVQMLIGYGRRGGFNVMVLILLVEVLVMVVVILIVVGILETDSCGSCWLGL